MMDDDEHQAGQLVVRMEQIINLFARYCPRDSHQKAPYGLSHFLKRIMHALLALVERKIILLLTLLLSQQ